MDARVVAKYLTSLKEKSGLTYEAIAEKCGMSETTIKNLFLGRTEDPRLNTVGPVTYALNGSIDEMYTGKGKVEIQEISLNSIKEMYEFQLAEFKASEEIRVANIRADHEKHREDINNHFERLLTEKDKNTLLWKKVALVCFGVACIGLIVLITLLILEVSNPELGWIKF